MIDEGHPPMQRAAIGLLSTLGNSELACKAICEVIEMLLRMPVMWRLPVRRPPRGTVAAAAQYVGASAMLRDACAATGLTEGQLG